MMGSKLAVVFLMFCLASLAMAHDAHSTVTVTHSIEEQSQFLTVIAEGIFGKVSRFMQAKLNILLWAKRMIIQVIIRGITYLKYLILHNPTFVSDIINLFADLVRTIVLNSPYFSVPQVVETLTNLLPLPYAH